MGAWAIQELTGYEPKTTFWNDFSIADKFGKEAIKDTFKRAFEEWKGDHINLTELVMVLNWKIWEWYEKSDSIGRLYNELWEQADGYAMSNLKDDELSYFLITTD